MGWIANFRANRTLTEVISGDSPAGVEAIPESVVQSRMNKCIAKKNITGLERLQEYFPDVAPSYGAIQKAYASAHRKSDALFASGLFIATQVEPDHPESENEVCEKRLTYFRARVIAKHVQRGFIHPTLQVGFEPLDWSKHKGEKLIAFVPPTQFYTINEDAEYVVAAQEWSRVNMLGHKIGEPYTKRDSFWFGVDGEFDKFTL